MSYDYYGFRPYASVAQRREKAKRLAAKLAKQGLILKPIDIAGRTIAHSFWGKSWCSNLEHYSDYANRLPRGRTYVRNGSVIHLDILPGEIKAMVSGSKVYDVHVRVAGLDEGRWKSLCLSCAGSIDSVVELLGGKLSQGVMERMCNQTSGLFPAPKDIKFTCSCPDWAYMCKHVAAVLYGIGARLDEEPELLFTLRGLNMHDLVAHAGERLDVQTRKKPPAKRVIADDDVAGIFGLEMAEPVPVPGRKGAGRPETQPEQKAKKDPATKATPPAKSTAKPKAGVKQPPHAGRKSAKAAATDPAMQKKRITTLGLSTRATNMLIRAGYKTAGQAMQASDVEFLRLKGMGMRTLREIRAKLAALR